MDEGTKQVTKEYTGESRFRPIYILIIAAVIILAGVLVGWMIKRSKDRKTYAAYDVVQMKTLPFTTVNGILPIRDGVLHDLSRIDPTGTRFHILHADCEGDAAWLRDAIREAYPQVGEITITSLGVVIGAHCGPGLLTVFYLCDSRRPE